MKTENLGVTFVVPVHNGGYWLDATLGAIFAQADGRPFEVITVDDGSTDDSPAILMRYANAGKLRLLKGPRRGATAALNIGVRCAIHPIICQVDQDVILKSGWMVQLVQEFSDPTVAAAQGYYATDLSAPLLARVMGFDLEQRYHRIPHRFIDHVCTGNTAYRAEALHRVGLFDESLGYGYDNDLSYRLAEAGYKLVFCRHARSVHCWREGLFDYLKQQYGFGFGRLDVVAKHRRRFRGDQVSDFSMMAHAPTMLMACGGLVCAAALAVGHWPWHGAILLSAAMLALLIAERLVAGLRATILFRTTTGLYFAPIHLVRDVAWAAAIVVWTVHRLSGRGTRPSDSM